MERNARDDNSGLFRQLADPEQADGAWGAIYELYWDTLFRFVCRKFPAIDQDDAKDIVEEVFIKLWLKRREVASRDIPISWLFQAAQNDGLDYLKTRKRRKQQPLEDSHLEIPDTATEPDGRWEKVWQAIARLPPGMRKVMEMKYGHGMANPRIAATLGRSYQTVGNQLLKGIRKLKEWLGAKKSIPSKHDSKNKGND